MMIKDGKLKKFFMFQLYECAAVEEFLCEMALKGWMVEKIKGAFFTFHKIEPKKLTFAVDIFEKASMFDTKLADSTLEYIEYCKEAGWEFICDSGKVQVFYSENEEEIPIHTDPKLKLTAINKGMLPFILYWILLFSIFSINIFNGFYIRDLSLIVTDYNTIGLFFLLINLAFIYFIYIFDYSIWLIKSIKRTKTSQDIMYNNKKKKHYKKLFILFILIFQSFLIIIHYASALIFNFSVTRLIFTLGIIALILIIIAINHIYFENKNHSRSDNIFFTIVLSMLSLLFMGFIMLGILFITINKPGSEMIAVTGSDGSVSCTSISYDQVPLTLDDLGISAERYRNSSADINETFLAQSYDYTDNYFSDIDDANKKIDYSVFTSPYPWITKKCVKSKLDHYYNISYEKVDSSLWGANAVYTRTLRDSCNDIIVVYDNKIFEFKSDISLNDEQILMIREKLDLL